MLTQNPSRSFQAGGAFDAVTSQDFAQNYSALATVGGAFETFCIESTVTFAPNVTYYYDLTQEDSMGRSLTMGAAYLYSQFATGQLPGYFTASDRSAEAGLLQSAIWELQGGQSMGDFPSYTTDPFYTLATNEFGGLAGAEAASDGAFNVDVLQMWDSPTSQIPGTDDHQNQLVYLGVPDTTYTGAMFGVVIASALALIAQNGQGRKPARVVVRTRRGKPGEIVEEPSALEIPGIFSIPR